MGSGGVAFLAHAHVHVGLHGLELWTVALLQQAPNLVQQPGNVNTINMRNSEESRISAKLANFFSWPFTVTTGSGYFSAISRIISGVTSTSLPD